MHISENKVFVFKFPYEGGDMTLPVPAESKEEAVEKLQKWLARVQTELAMEFPKVSGDVSGTKNKLASQADTVPGGIPYDVLDMRIDTLLGDLGAKNLAPNLKVETIEHWTGITYMPENYAKIITELELIASGQKEIAPKPKKKGNA